MQWVVSMVGIRQTPFARRGVSLFSAALLLLCHTIAVLAQTSNEKPVPILTGSAGYFTNVTGGQTELEPIVSPLVLLPLGDHWLIESRGEFEGDFERRNGNGPFGGGVDKEVEYLQADYIAISHVTVTVGRFLTPFGIFNERLYPIWIRSLQPLPLIFPIGTGSSNGAMLRGGFPVAPKVNINYAVYFSTLSTTNALDSERTAGGRVGFFLPGPRVEVGASFQKMLQDDRSHAVGFHFAWQPNSVPLNLRSEYARSTSLGSGYWIEAAYRLSQVPHWQSVMRRVEVVGRAQQFFASEYAPYYSSEYGLPAADTQEGDFGLNYFLRDGLKATASYGRQFSSWGNANQWSVGIAYRFAFPLGRMGAQ